MTTDQYMWLKHSTSEREELLRLLISGQRVMAIKHVRTCIHIGLNPAKQFVDSPWLLEKLCEADPTRMPPKDEFKTEVLRVVTDMLGTIGEPNTMAKDKYESLTNDVTKLFDLCMEE